MRIGPLSWRGPLFRVSAAAARRGAGWQPSGKRTHLLYEIISNQIQHRMSPVWRHSGEAGLRGGGDVRVGAHGCDFLQTACRLVLTVVSTSRV